MNQLLPIVRRVRRPLIVSDVPVAVVGSVEPPIVNTERVARNAEQKLVNEVSGETVAAPQAIETTGGTPVPPTDKSCE